MPVYIIKNILNVYYKEYFLNSFTFSVPEILLLQFTSKNYECLTFVLSNIMLHVIYHWKALNECISNIYTVIAQKACNFYKIRPAIYTFSIDYKNSLYHD